MNLSTNQKIGLGVLAGIILAVAYNSMGPKKLKITASGADGEDSSFAEGESYDFDSDYDLAEGDVESGFVGDELFSDASGDKGKKRKLKHWQRRVKILTKKINLANKGLIKAQGRVDKWKTKLTEAQNKVAEFSK